MDKILKRDTLEYTKERERFLKDLFQFHCNRGTPYQKLPHIQGKAADLYLLYSLISTSGGYNKVNEGDRWDDFAEVFDLPKGCANGSQALKQIYLRYLYLYERMHLFGDDPDHADEGDEYDEPGASSATALQRKHDRAFCSGGVPLVYNYRQHHVDNTQRHCAGLSTAFAQPNQYAKIEKSLLCGLPNEVDFAFNVCTMLSAESSHALRLLTHPGLLDLLLAHVGICSEDSSLKALYEGLWSSALGRDFLKFWRSSTEDAELLSWALLQGNSRESDEPLLAAPDDTECASVLSSGSQPIIRQAEGLRSQQVAAILRNLSFDGCNARALASNADAFRFMLLCSNSKCPSIKHNGLEMFSNVAARLVLKPLPDETTQLVFRAVHRCLSSSDKFEIVSGLEIIANLARVEANEDMLSDNLDLMTYDSIVSSMKVRDIQLIASALDTLYQLSELGDRTCDNIAHTAHCIEMLVNLVTVEAHSFGDEAVVGIRVVDETHRAQDRAQLLQPPPPSIPYPLAASAYRPPPSMAGGAPPAAALPSFQPPRGPALQHHHTIGGAPAGDVHCAAMMASSPPAALNPEAIACNWLRVNFEPNPESTVSTASMLSDYMVWLQKKSLPGLQGAQQFINCVKYVFPSTDCIRRATGPSGAADLLHVGLKRRESSATLAALPTLLPASTATMTAQSRSSTPHPPALPMHSALPAMAGGGALCNGPVTTHQQQQQHVVAQALFQPASTQLSASWNGTGLSPRILLPMSESQPPYPRPPVPSFLHVSDNLAAVAPDTCASPPVASASSALKNLLQSRLIQNQDLGMAAVNARASASSHVISNGNSATTVYGCSSGLPLVGDWTQQHLPCVKSNLPSAMNRMPHALPVPAVVSPQSPRSHSPRRVSSSRPSRASARLATMGTPPATLFPAMSQRVLELQICGEAEKACDISIAAAEAKIERVENLGAREDPSSRKVQPAEEDVGSLLKPRNNCTETGRAAPDVHCNGRAVVVCPPPAQEDEASQASASGKADCLNGGCETMNINGHGSDCASSSPDDQHLVGCGDSDEGSELLLDHRKWLPRATRHHMNGLVNGIDSGLEKRRSSRLKSSQPVSNGVVTMTSSDRAIGVPGKPCCPNASGDHGSELQTSECSTPEGAAAGPNTAHAPPVSSSFLAEEESCSTKGTISGMEAVVGAAGGIAIGKASSVPSSPQPPEKRLRTTSSESDNSSASSPLSSVAATTVASSQHTPLSGHPSLSAAAAFLCEWASCGRLHEDTSRMRLHVLEEHLQQTVIDGSCCLWEACDSLKRQRWSLVSHVLDKHCTEAALKMSLARRQLDMQPRTIGSPLPPPPLQPIAATVTAAAAAAAAAAPAMLPPVYGTDAARLAIMRNADRAPYADIVDAREGPVTKHFRYTSALILRNVARYSATGLSIIKKHESTLSYVALSSMESSAVASGCLWEMHQQPQQQQ